MFNQGDVVQLRSGGPLMTVTSCTDNRVNVVYHNPVSGLICSDAFGSHALRGASDRPTNPEDQQRLRSTPVTSSFTS